MLPAGRTGTSASAARWYALPLHIRRAPSPARLPSPRSSLCRAEGGTTRCRTRATLAASSPSRASSRSVRTSTPDGYGPLRPAASSSHSCDCVQPGETPLHVAAIAGDLPLAEALVALGANPQLPTEVRRVSAGLVLCSVFVGPSRSARVGFAEGCVPARGRHARWPPDGGGGAAAGVPQALHRDRGGTAARDARPSTHHRLALLVCTSLTTVGPLVRRSFSPWLACPN